MGRSPTQRRRLRETERHEVQEGSTRYAFAITIACLLLAARPGRAEPSFDGTGEATDRRFAAAAISSSARPSAATAAPAPRPTCTPPEPCPPPKRRRPSRKSPDTHLFLADGSDDGQGNGVSRMLADATILVQAPE